MVKFELDGQHYQTPEGFHDIKFGQYLHYLEYIAPKTPEQFTEALTGGNFEADWFNMEGQKKFECFEYFTEVIGHFVGLDSEVIHSSMDDLQQLQDAFFDILLTLYQPNAEDMSSFMLDGVEYHLPDKHMEGATVGEFAEASQYEDNLAALEGGRWMAMADIMVVIARPNGEKYSFDKNTHNRRKNKFLKKLDMQTVINASFFLRKQNRTLHNNLLIYSMLVDLEQKDLERYRKFMDGIS